MCAHFIMIPKDELNRIIADVKRNLQAQEHANLSASYQDVYCKADVPILIPDRSRLEVEVMKWGYQVDWQKGVVYNTKAETALGPRPSMWDESIRHRRCIVPSFGFFEPNMKDTYPSPRTGKPIKDQYRFNLPGSDIVYMAGVYEDGHFSVMTTKPNAWMKDIHPRMPMVLRPEELKIWLHEDYKSLADRSSVELVAQKVAV